MTYSKQRSRRFVPVTPDVHGIRRKRIIFSIMNIVIAVVVVIILTVTLLALL